MGKPYDKYYQTENLFGEPYPELMDIFSGYSERGRVLDLGCGQGRDAISLARIGFDVTGIDNSKVGIEQLKKIAKSENLSLTGIVADLFEFNKFSEYDFVLLDSMFHFTKKDRKKETDLIKRILSEVKSECLIVICIQDTGNKVEILNKTIEDGFRLNRHSDKTFKYTFEDKESGHKSETDYRMVVVEKL